MTYVLLYIFQYHLLGGWHNTALQWLPNFLPSISRDMLSSCHLAEDINANIQGLNK